MLSQTGCTEVVATVAMQGNDPVMGVAIWIIDATAVNIILRCDLNCLTGIFTKKCFVCFLLCNFSFCNGTFGIIGSFRDFQCNSSISTITRAANGIIYKVISGKQGNQNEQSNKNCQDDQYDLFDADFFLFCYFHLCKNLSLKNV